MDKTLMRARVVAEARSWLRTPYHPGAGIKRAGVDCGMLPIRVYGALGLIPAIDPGQYSPQWHMHRQEERYLALVMANSREIDTPPGIGDFVLWRIGRLWAHGAIVTEWPMVIHAVSGIGVEIADVSRDCLGARHKLADLDIRTFTVFGERD